MIPEASPNGNVPDEFPRKEESIAETPKTTPAIRYG